MSKTQEQHYQNEIADLKAEVKTLKRALAAAHGELASPRENRRLRHQPTWVTPLQTSGMMTSLIYTT